MSLALGAVMLAQMLGLMHQLVHAPHDSPGGAANLAHRPHDHEGTHGPAWIDALFANHDEGSNSCRVFDQQGHHALMSAVASLALPNGLRAPAPPEGIDCPPAAAIAAFEARAPPSAR